MKKNIRHPLNEKLQGRHKIVYGDDEGSCNGLSSFATFQKQLFRNVESFRSDIQYEPPRDKTNKLSVRPAKTQITLGIRQVWSESSLCAQWVAKNPSFLHADSKDSDETGRMPRLIWVFAGRTTTLLVLSWGGSYQPAKTDWNFRFSYYRWSLMPC